MVLRKVAVTGVSGLVGSHLLTLLQNNNVSVAATSRHPVENQNPDFSWSKWDLAKWKSHDELENIFGHPDALLHIGAMVPNHGTEDHLSRQEIFDVNVRSCLCLGEWALRKKIPVVFLSGATVYADPFQRHITEDQSKSVFGFGAFYGASKWYAEQIFDYLTREGLQRIILRPSSIYGYGLGKQKMISRFLELAKNNQPIELLPPEEDRINLIHATDVAEAMWLALTKKAWGVFNIAGPATHSIREIAEACVNVVESGKIQVLKDTAQREPKMRFDLSAEAAHHAFGFTPKLDLHQGIKRMWIDINRSCTTKSDSENARPRR